MAREVLNLKQAADHIHVEANELRHVAQRGEIDAIRRGDDWFFEHSALDEWAQRSILAAPLRVLRTQHRAMAESRRRDRDDALRLADLFPPDGIDLFLPAKAKAGLLRDMTDLAAKTGKVYDEDALFKELVAREEIASTAIGESLALLHPRTHDPYLFEETFVAYGRSVRPVFFGAPDAQGTRHFFLVCSVNHEQHLHILAQLALLSHGTDLVARLEAAAREDEVLSAIAACEREFIR